MDKKDRKRYSEGFKLHVMEELRDGKWKTPTEAALAYESDKGTDNLWHTCKNLSSRILQDGDF